MNENKTAGAERASGARRWVHWFRRGPSAEGALSAAPIGQRHADAAYPKDLAHGRDQGPAKVEARHRRGTDRWLTVNSLLRLPRPKSTLMFLVILTALGAVTTISPAQAQLLINLDRAGYPASISTATPHATWHFEWVASGSTSAFCSNPNTLGICDPSDFVAKQEIDIVWEKYDRIGPPVPNYSSGDLQGRTTIDWETKKPNDTYRWTGDINGFSASDDRPMLATVHLRKVGTNWTLGSTTSLQFAVNPQIFGASASATEGTDANMVFNIGMFPPALETITVDYATQDGTAKAGDDYTATSGTLTFNVGDSVKTVNVPITNDMVDDSGEVFALRVSNPSGVTRLTERFRSPDGLTPAEFVTVLSLSGTILNDEPGPDDAVDNLPLVTVEATTPYATEGSDAVFKLTRSGETTEALSVSVSTTETGAMLAGSSATSATFAAGESEAQLRIATVGRHHRRRRQHRDGGPADR